MTGSKFHLEHSFFTMKILSAFSIRRDCRSLNKPRFTVRYCSTFCDEKTKRVGRKSSDAKPWAKTWGLVNPFIPWKVSCQYCGKDWIKLRLKSLLLIQLSICVIPDLDFKSEVFIFDSAAWKREIDWVFYVQFYIRLSEACLTKVHMGYFADYCKHICKAVLGYEFECKHVLVSIDNVEKL